MTLTTPTSSSLRMRKADQTRKTLKDLAIWLCSVALLAPTTALLSSAFAAPTVTTTTTLATGATSVAVGTPVLLTASVTGTAPTGTVTFKRGTTTLGTGTLAGTGNTRTATYSATFTTVASNSLTAVYGADAVNKTSTSAAKTVSSTKATPTNTLTSSLNPSTSGASVTFTATVTGYNPTGTVTFKDGTTTLGTGTLAGTGNTRTATYTKANLTVASHSITAVYAGNTLNNTVTSAALSQVVGPVKTTATATVNSNLNPSTAGASVTLTASVTGTAPTGVVTFKDGTTTLGTGTLAGTGNTRTATFATTALAVASHSITAAYAGDTANTTATSSAVNQVVNKAATSTTLASSANPSTFAQNVIFTAVVTGAAPTGYVTFNDGATFLGTATLTNGTANFAYQNLVSGTHSISAVYAGDGNNASSTSSTLNQVVNGAITNTSLTVSPNPANTGETVTFNAYVEGTGPSGNVTFKDGAITLGTSPVLGGGAIFSLNTLTAGTHSITAVFEGDANNSPSTSNVRNLVVNPAIATSTTTLASSANPTAPGTSIIFTATVSGNTPSGVVTFKNGTATLGTGTVTAGVATFSTSALTAGNHSITAVYAGDAGNTTSTSAALIQTITAALVGNPMTWQFGYDAMGRPTTTQDPYGKTAYTYYDTLGRPIQTQQAVGSEQSIVQYDYNGADSLTKVTDPRSLETTYNPTGLGTVTSQTSPDTGTASATFDANRNLTSKTDARGKTTTYSYDTLNRLINADYSTGTDTTLEYDGGSAPTPSAAGELTKVTDESGQTSFTYDSAGRLSSKTQITNGKTFTVTYTWGDTGSSLDKVIAITYPSGNRVNYVYDAFGSVSGITVNTVNANGIGFSGAASSLLSAITLTPGGEVSGWTWASGKMQSRTYDQYGQPSGYQLGDPTGTGISAGTVRTIGYDGAGHIMAYSHTNNGAPAISLNQSFAYDDLTRLVSASLGSSSIQYSYDLNGNRTSKVISGTAYNNTVSSTSNKLTQTQDVGSTTPIQYDAMGNITNDGVNTYTYSDRGRLSSVTTAGGVVNYRYNGFEQRAYKNGPTALIPTGAAYYVYDESGKLLGEYDANNNPIYETIYLGMSPVGVLKQTGTAQSANITTSTYNVYSDHLATPRVITRSTDEAIVWRWDAAEAFGATMPDQNPNNLGTFTFNQRLPGQVFDAETGLFQNWHREYNARLGRYIQSDPIGLAGGINTYGYVGGNPLSFSDPRGLDPWWKEPNDGSDGDTCRVSPPRPWWENPRPWWDDPVRYPKPNDPPLDPNCPECNLLGMGGLLKAGFGLAKSVASGAPSLTKLLAEAAPVGSGLKGDGGHYAAVFVRDEALKAGKYTTVVGGDGVARISVTLGAPGGRFEYMYQQGVTGWEMTHQFFRPIK